VLTAFDRAESAQRSGYGVPDTILYRRFDPIKVWPQLVHVGFFQVGDVFCAYEFFANHKQQG